MLKNLLIKKLKDSEDHFEPLEGSLEILSFSISMQEDLPLRGYLESIENNEVLYFSNLESEFLALGTHNNNDTKHEEIIQLLDDDNKKAFLFAAIPFQGEHQQEHFSKSWKNWNLPSYIVPTLTLIKEKESSDILVQILVKKNNPSTKRDQITRLLEGFKFSSPSSIAIITDGEPLEAPNKKDWHTYLSKTLKLLRDQENKLTKIVCARSTVLITESNVSSTRLFNQIKSDSKYHFFIKSKNLTFIGNTPECLLTNTNEDDLYEFDALAGTLPRGKNKAQDHDLEIQLLNCPKEQFEHQQVVSFITEGLSDLGVVQVKPSYVLKLKSLQHIKTPITLKPKNNSASFLMELITRLHPTPAVCGLPKKMAMDFLIKEDPIERGLYAGALGVIGTHQVDLCVGIRSLLINKTHSQLTKITLFGGAGIVSKSDPISEWDETANKMKSFSPVVIDQ